MSEVMDAPPNIIMRWVGEGALDRAMKAESIWLCVACQTCTARCPQDVDTAGIIDEVRAEAGKRNIIARAMARTPLFFQAFLDTVRDKGRLDETALVSRYKIRGFFSDFKVKYLLKDATLAPRLMARGKLHLSGNKVKDAGIVRRIFDRCK